jgi:hypothetical protein
MISTMILLIIPLCMRSDLAEYASEYTSHDRWDLAPEIDDH